MLNLDLPSPYGADFKGFCEQARLVDMANYYKNNMPPPSEAGRFASKISKNPRRKAWVNPNLYGQRIRVKTNPFCSCNPCSFDHFSVAEGSENQLHT